MSTTTDIMTLADAYASAVVTDSFADELKARADIRTAVESLVAERDALAAELASAALSTQPEPAAPTVVEPDKVDCAVELAAAYCRGHDAGWSSCAAHQPRTALTDEQITKILDRERMRWATSPPTYEFALAFARAILAAAEGKP